ncbi:MAG: hypothetical protein FJX23_09640 [Alphaproteobacteria bacterium]|nr:hypothetical protein [Alphaproteobacteria bacterium]
MKTYEYAENSPITRVEFRQGMSGQEAVIFPSTEVKSHNTVTLPDALRKQGFSAELGVSGREPVLKVKGFTDASQVLDTITAQKLGSPVAERGEGKFASAVTASRQGAGERSR